MYSEATPAEIRGLPSIETLRRIWGQQYFIERDRVHWREKKQHGFPPARQMIASPDDREARYASKEGNTWTGYKIHLTETCEVDAPRLVTHVETTVATTRDASVIDKVQTDLADRSRKPEVHLADTGYTDAGNLVSSQERGIDLVGPVRPDSRWQAKVDDGYDASQSEVDWEQMVATCPQGQTSAYWKRGWSAHGQASVHFLFKRSVCQRCVARSLCTQSKKSGRALTLYPQEKHEALQPGSARQLRRSGCCISNGVVWKAPYRRLCAAWEFGAAVIEGWAALTYSMSPQRRPST